MMKVNRYSDFRIINSMHLKCSGEQANEREIEKSESEKNTPCTTNNDKPTVIIGNKSMYVYAYDFSAL